MTKQKKYENLKSNEFVRLRDVQKKKKMRKTFVVLFKNDFDFIHLFD